MNTLQGTISDRCSLHDKIERNLPHIAVHFIKALPVFGHVEADQRGTIDAIPEPIARLVK